MYNCWACVQEVVSGVIDTRDGTSFLQAVWEHLSLILIPALKQSQKWGPVSQQRVNQFLCSLDNYVDFLKSMLPKYHNMCALRALCTGAQKSINEAVYLSLESPVELEKLSTSEGCVIHARQLDTVAALEELVLQWCQQIEQVYTFCNLIVTMCNGQSNLCTLNLPRCWQRGVRCVRKQMTPDLWLSWNTGSTVQLNFPAWWTRSKHSHAVGSSPHSI